MPLEYVAVTSSGFLIRSLHTLKLGHKGNAAARWSAGQQIRVIMRNRYNHRRPDGGMATQRSCKTFYPGSNPGRASTQHMADLAFVPRNLAEPAGSIGRRVRVKCASSRIQADAGGSDLFVNLSHESLFGFPRVRDGSALSL